MTANEIKMRVSLYPGLNFDAALLQDYSRLAESQRGPDGNHADVEADVQPPAAKGSHRHPQLHVHLPRQPPTSWPQQSTTYQ